MIDRPTRIDDSRRAARALKYAALAYAVGLLVHAADHLRRGLDLLTPEVFWAGGVTGVAAVAAIWMVLTGHRLAPLVAFAHGITQGLGVAAVHLLPSWGAFSDSLPDGRADVLSWAATLVEIVAALALGVAGAYLLRYQAGRAPDRGAIGTPSAVP